MCVSILAVCICFTASNTNSHYAYTGALDNPYHFFFFKYPIICMSSIAPKRILVFYLKDFILLSAQQNIKLILLCMSHCKYKVRTQQNQVILGPVSHAELQKSRRKRNIWSPRHAAKCRCHYACRRRYQWKTLAFRNVTWSSLCCPVCILHLIRPCS